MHPIIALWSHPRSVSSAMERIMYERGDLTTLHEPFIYLFYVGDAKKQLMHFDIDPAHPTSYADIRQMILEAGEIGPVFFKDMSYYVSDYILDDAAFTRRLSNTFLIRTPRKSIPSYYKIDKQLLTEEVGLEAQWHHFDYVRQLTNATPVVIDADDLQADTEATMRAYCRHLSLAFVPESLTWDEPVPAEWRHVAGWHGDLNATSGIAQGGQSAHNVDDNEVLKGLYEHHNPYYQKLSQFRINVSL